MSLKNVFLLAWSLAKSASPPVRAAVFGGLPLLLLATAWVAPAKLPALAAGLAALATMFALQIGRMLEGVLLARLEPLAGYGEEVDVAAVEEVSRRLAALGFKAVGLYGIRRGEALAALLALANEDLKVYAVIHCGDRRARPLTRLYSHYEGGRIYVVDNGRPGAAVLYPSAVVNDPYPGRGPDELLEILLRDRPDKGLLETPPEGFERFENMLKDRLRDHLLRPDRR